MKNIAKNILLFFISFLWMIVSNANNNLPSNINRVVEDYYANDGKRLNLMSGIQKNISKEYPLTKNLQSILDKLWNTAKKIQKVSKDIPPLVLILLEKPKGNAFVKAVPRCFNIELASESKVIYPQAGAVVINSEGFLEMTSADQKCETISYESLLRSIFGKVNSKIREGWNTSNVNCQVYLENGVLNARKECFDREDYQYSSDIVSFNQFYLYSTSNLIHFSIDLLLKLNPKQIVAIMAHELGHYIYAHTSSFGKKNKIFAYESDQKRTLGKIPMRGTNDQQKVIDNAIKVGEFPRFHPAFLKAKYHPFLSVAYDEILATIRKKNKPPYRIEFLEFYLDEEEITGQFVCGKGSQCDIVCSEVGEKIGSDFWFTNLLVNIDTLSEISPDLLTRYLKKEDLILECVNSIDNYKNYAQSSSVNIRSNHDYIMDIIDTSGMWLERDQSEKMSLVDIFRVLSLQARKSENTFINYLSSGLQIYTPEQEADEFAARLITKMGIEGKYLVDLLLNFKKWRYEENSKLLQPYGLKMLPFLGDFDFQICKILRENGWKDRNGKKIKIPAHKTDDDHLPGCFRVYSADKYQERLRVEKNEIRNLIDELEILLLN